MRTKTRLLSVIAVAFLTTGTPINAQAPPKEPVIVKIKVCEPMRITGDVKLLLDSPLVNGTLVGKSFDVNGGYIVKEGIKVVLGTQTLTAGTATPLTFVLPKDIVVPAKTEPAIGSIFFVDEKDESKFVVLLTIGGKKIEPGDYQKLDSSDFAVAVQSNQIDNAKNSKESAAANAKADAAIASANNNNSEIIKLKSEFKKFKGKTIAAINANNSIAAKVEELEKKVATLEQQLKLLNEGKAPICKLFAEEIVQLKNQLQIDPSTGQSARLSNLESQVNGLSMDMKTALKNIEEAQHSLVKLQSAPKSVAPVAPLPPAEALYSIPGVTTAEYTDPSTGSMYQRQPCGRYKKVS